jgi:hypothetical protein
MLGRLRMTVDQCIDEYETLAGEVFGNPRKLHLRTCGPFVPREKYNHHALEKFVKSVTKKRVVPQDPNDIPRPLLFDSPEDLCKT